MEIPGGEGEARLRWGKNVAAGKLGVVCAPGRKPRLIGDGTISGTKDACQINEKVRLPSLECVQQFMSRMPPEKPWCAWSWDVRGAHKLVRVREPECGFQCFAFEGKWYYYRCCYFGARWSAFWFSRVGSFLLRHLHRYIWIAHAAFLYVDDGLCLLPAEVGPLIAASSLLFMCALGVPFSWEKMSLGQDFVWLGWHFQLSTLRASVPEPKKTKLLPLLKVLCRSGGKPERRLVERVVGMLVWLTSGLQWLRPWLEPFYQILCKPRATSRLLTLAQFAEVCSLLNAAFRLQSDARSCDVCAGWRLHSVNNCQVSQSNTACLRTPVVRNGQVSVVFFDYCSKTTASSKESVWAAQLFRNALAQHVSLPLWVKEDADLPCAADAFATADSAGVGGWWIPPGQARIASNARWFHMTFSRESLPIWFKAASNHSLQACIAAFEALGQLILLVLRCSEEPLPPSWTVRLSQLCDNQSVTHATMRMLSTKQPLSYILQALGFYCAQLGVVLACSHIAGDRNAWAHDLSHSSVPQGFVPEHQRSLDVLELLEQPWKSFTVGGGVLACE